MCSCHSCGLNSHIQALEFFIPLFSTLSFGRDVKIVVRFCLKSRSLSAIVSKGDVKARLRGLTLEFISIPPGPKEGIMMEKVLLSNCGVQPEFLDIM